jgi:SnoaL-like domain
MSSQISAATRSVEDRLQALEDRIEIYTLMAKYSTVVDAFDFQSMGEIFTPDGTLGNGSRINSVSIFQNIDPAMLRGVAEMGLAHLHTPPYIKLGKNTAVLFSYSCVTVLDPTADSIEVPQHGSGRGHRLFIIAANRWDLVRYEGAWRIKQRQLVLCDGSDTPRELQRSVLNAVVE